jgi:hypothetical protein
MPNPALEQHFRRKLLDGLSKGRNLSEALYQLVRQDAADEARKELAKALLSDEPVDGAARDAYDAWNAAGGCHRFAEWDLLPGRARRVWVGIAQATIEAALNSSKKGEGDAS